MMKKVAEKQENKVKGQGHQTQPHLKGHITVCMCIKF